MRLRVKRVLLMAALAGGSASIALGQSISTGFTGATVINPAAGTFDDYNGNFFDVTALSGDVTINSWEIHSNQAAGIPLTVQIWYKPGSWVGFHNNQGAWTLAGEVPATAAGAGNPTPVVVTPFTVPLGQTYGIRIGANPGKLRYHSATQTVTPFSNNDVRLDFGAAQATIWTGGLAAQPRGWNGTIYYSVSGTQPGACCRSDGTCVVALPGDCTAQGGTYQGAGTTCVGQCPQPGACCMPDGTCTFVLQTACLQGGVWQAGTTCAAANCPLPGACCLANGGCVNLLETECSAMGGTFNGAGTNCGAGQCWSPPILYHNGSMVTHVGGGFNGADASQLPAGGNTIGENCNFAALVRITDDFTVPPGQTWTVNRIRTWAYQTSSVGFTMTNFYARIWDRDPNDPGAVVVWGDAGTFTTNVMDASGSGLDSIYRVTGNLLDTARQLQRLEAAVPNVQLGAGTYWLEWSTTGSTASGPFIPPVTVLSNIPRGNAQIWRNAPWAPVVDINWNVAQYPGGQPMGLPFIIEGSVGGGCYANCDNSTQAPILNVQDFTCFLQRYAAGESYANCDNSTQQPVLNVQDFTCFLQRYAAGCP